MVRNIVIAVLFGALASLSATPLSAQSAVLGQKYGFGVHAYFAGDSFAAHEQLTAAIAGGSRDPRAFYFRGLANLRLGREPEAAQDFDAGAALESKDVSRFYNVSKALERVQGAPRMALEKHRVEARMAALEASERIRKARYEAIQREESRVTRPMPPAPLEPLVPAQPAAAPAAEPSTDVFAAPAEAKPAAAPAAPKPSADMTPSLPPAEEQKPAVKESPAAEEKPAPAAEKPAENEKPKVDAEADPFAM